MPPKRSGVQTRSSAKNVSTSRSNSRRSSRQQREERDIVDVFNEFRDVFDGASIPTQESLSSSSGSSSSSSSSESEEQINEGDSANRNVAASRSDEMPSWAKSLLQNQQKAIENSDKKLHDLRKEIRSLKRKRSKDDEDGFDWKKKGNKKQYKFNRSVEEQFEEIATTDKLLTARMAAEKGLKLIKKRNKMLKIADTHGWDTVLQYEADPLASNEQDDKRLRKAIKDAGKARDRAKVEKEAKARRFARARAFSRESPLSPARLGPAANSGPRDKRVVLPAVDKPSRINCFRCGKPGHMIRDCQSVGANTPTNVN